MTDHEQPTALSGELLHQYCLTLQQLSSVDKSHKIDMTSNMTSNTAELCFVGNVGASSPSSF